MVLPLSRLCRLAAALALLGPAQQAFAQPASAPARADPLDARAAVPPAGYSSSFAPYRRMSETPVGSWREANDTVTQIGGWRAYARESAAAPKPPEASPVTSPPAEVPKAGAPNTATPDARGAHGHGSHAPK